MGMEKIKLSKNQKRIIKLLYKEKYHDNYSSSDDLDLAYLHEIGFVVVKQYTNGIIYECKPQNKMFAYLNFNPDLDNPSIWDDKKYVVTTIISIIALIISIIALIRVR